MDYLSVHPDDRALADAILTEASKQRAEREEVLIKALASHVGFYVSKAFGG